MIQRTAHNLAAIQQKRMDRTLASLVTEGRPIVRRKYMHRGSRIVKVYDCANPSCNNRVENHPSNHIAGRLTFCGLDCRPQSLRKK